MGRCVGMDLLGEVTLERIDREHWGAEASESQVNPRRHPDRKRHFAATSEADRRLAEAAL